LRKCIQRDRNDRNDSILYCSYVPKLLLQLYTDEETVHRKKRFTSFPSPAGLSLTKLPLGRNNSVIMSLFPPRESLVVTSRLGDGKLANLFLRCTLFALGER
jgi:hypothetical protein